MKKTGRCVLDCIKQLLPNLAASGLWEPIAKLSGPIIAPVLIAAGVSPTLVPAAIGVACVAAYIGLSRMCATKSEEAEQRDLAAALDIIRRQTKNAREELAELGYQLEADFEETRRRLLGIDQAIAELAAHLDGRFDALDEQLREYFATHGNRFDDLTYFLQRNFNSLRQFLNDLPTLEELHSDIASFREQLTRIEITGDKTLAVSTETRDLVAGGNVEILKEMAELKAMLKAATPAAKNPRANFTGR